MNRPDWLPGEDIDGELAFSIDSIRKSFEVRELPNGWLVLRIKDIWVSFSVLRFLQSEVGGASSFGSLVFYGEGPSSALRECRHTYWGEDGYLFYPDGMLITAAFRELSEFFDDLAPPQDPEKA